MRRIEFDHDILERICSILSSDGKVIVADGEKDVVVCLTLTEYKLLNAVAALASDPVRLVEMVHEAAKFQRGELSEFVSLSDMQEILGQLYT